MSSKCPYLMTSCLLLFVALSATFFNSSVSATDSTAQDNVSVSVPVSCTMNGTGMDSHNATIPNGTYQADIGTTTLKAFCNDSAGFAVYAIGYTNEEYGNTNLIGTSQGQNIVTGTATTSGNPDVSNWAVKLATNSSVTYPLTLDNSFGNYHSVPTTYTKVAHRDSATDIGTSAIGSTLTTTYAAYISKTQAADTYNGKVKYTLVHPAAGPEPVYEGQVGVVFNGTSEQTFPGGATTNRVVYGVDCETDYYIGTTPAISKTPNVDNDGMASSGFQMGLSYNDPITISGATKLKVEIAYSMDQNYDYLYLFDGNYTGPVEQDMEAGQVNTYSAGVAIEGVFEPEVFDTVYINGDTVTFAFYSDESDVWDGFYGYYAKVYPIYGSEQSGAEEVLSCSSSVDSGAYAMVAPWNGEMWYTELDGVRYNFLDQNEILSFLNEHGAALRGTTLNMNLGGVAFSGVYASSGKTKTNGYYIIQDLDNTMCHAVEIGDTIKVIDVRDNNIYTIGKLADGNCWMLENLRLDPTDSATASNMSASNTNAPAAAITNYLNGGNPGGNTGWSSVAVSRNPSSNGSVPYVYVDYANDTSFAYGPAAINGYEKIGVYYSYCAATAGTYCYNGSHSGLPDTLMDAPYSLCPINWRLPTGGDGGEFGILYESYDNTLIPFNNSSFYYNFSVIYSGYVSSYFGPGGVSDYWSGWTATDYDNYGNMYYFEINDYGANNYSMDLDDGLTMRCILDNK